MSFKSLSQGKETMMAKDDKKIYTIDIIKAVLLYLCSSIAMVIVNKMVLKKVETPILFLWGQLVVASLILKTMANFNIIEISGITYPIMKKMIPLVTINILGLTLNTLCLHQVDTTIYQIARSLVLPITVSLNPIFSQETISRKVRISCGIIIIGFSIGIFGDLFNNQNADKKLSISPLGIVFGILSAFSTALHSFIIKHSFETFNESNSFDLVYLNNALSSAFMTPLIVIEYINIHRFVDNFKFAPFILLIGVVITGIIGLVINYAGFLQIKITSPLTHTVSSSARGVLQTLSAWFFLNETISTCRAMGIFVTLFGSACYSREKYLEQQRKNEIACRKWDKLIDEEKESLV